MNDSVFFRSEFFLLILFSLLMPAAIYALLLVKKAVTPLAFFIFGMMLLILSSFDIVLLQHLASAAKQSPSLLDDQLFASEVSLAIYLLPLLSAGIGTNIVSYVLIGHFTKSQG
ncbi:MAG: hypothetical protein V4568_19260 [Pseudomonadota bacterium]